MTSGAPGRSLAASLAESFWAPAAERLRALPLKSQGALVTKTKLAAHWAVLADHLREHLDYLERDRPGAPVLRDSISTLRLAIRKFDNTVQAFRAEGP